MARAGQVISAEALAQALDGKTAGPGKWKALCPAHDDSKPSLSITTGRTGGAIFVCRAGCMQEQVIEALQARGLWSQSRGRLSRSPSARSASSPPPEPQRLDASLILEQLDQLLTNVDIIDADAPYMVVGELLEGAACVSYHVVARTATAAGNRSACAQRHVAQWMADRYPDALFDNRL